MFFDKKIVLPVIVLSQFLCTSLWFGGNAVLSDFSKDLHLPPSALASITSFIQFGFITGTLVFAILTMADRYKPSAVFFSSAVAAALANGLIIFSKDFSVVLVLRFSTGFFLAGIYPVGMKIAADHYEKGLGKALGYLVGALVLGTAFPHLLKSMSVTLSWKDVLISISVMSIIGGLFMLLLVPKGSYRKAMQKIDIRLAFKVFQNKEMRSAAFGYFGHMWELYTFWAFVPVIIDTYLRYNKVENMSVSLISFVVIASGTISCIASGYFSQKTGVKKTAFIALLCSCCCCIISPLSFSFPIAVFILFLIFWGATVVADSPMFSTLIAANTTGEQKGTALTIVTSVGFFITIVSIEVLNLLRNYIDEKWLYIFLCIGPLLGLVSLNRKREN